MVRGMRDAIREYLDYLRDNPEGYWFKRKLYGWGWTPARWQGWVSVGVYALSLAVLGLRLDPEAALADVLWTFMVPFLALTLVLILVAYKTGEKPRWQWGRRIDGKNEDGSNGAIE